MKFTLDENFGTRTQHLFTQARHDVDLVRQEKLQAAPDPLLHEVCRGEDRCMVTLDMDFSDVVRFSAGNTSGIAVIRPGRNPNLKTLEILVNQLQQAVETMQLNQHLRIMESGRIRVHQPERYDWE